MKKQLFVKTYIIVFVIIFIGGTVWSMINGYRFFCDGLKSCDQFGVTLSWSEFSKRQLISVLVALGVSAFITFMLLKDKESEKGGSKKL